LEKSKLIQPLKEFQKFSLSLPTSKSLAQRAYICASLAKGESLIKNPPRSEDPELLKEALETSGVEFRAQNGDYLIRGLSGRLLLSGKRVYLGNNGTGARFFLAFSSLGEGNFLELYGKERLHERPMGPLISALRALGAKIECLEKEGYFPLRVYEGEPKSREIKLPGNISSQFISALLLIGPYLPNGLFFEVEGELLSESYVLMTLKVMEDFGVKVEKDRNFYRVSSSNYKARVYEVPADASSASYFLAIPLILGKGEVEISNYDAHSPQADNVFLEYIKAFGGEVSIGEPFGVRVSFEGRPRALSINLKDSPDLFPTLAIIGAVAEGKTVLYGAPHLRYKETDRIRAVATELKKLGVTCEELPDGLIIYGAETFKPAKIETYDDHRIAMAFAVLGLKTGPLEIENPKCVAKSFPNFWELFEKLYESAS